MLYDRLAQDLYTEICHIPLIDPHSHIDPLRPTARSLDDILQRPTIPPLVVDALAAHLANQTTKRWWSNDGDLLRGPVSLGRSAATAGCGWSLSGRIAAADVCAQLLMVELERFGPVTRQVVEK
jgi:hypothetical protein